MGRKWKTRKIELCHSGTCKRNFGTPSQNRFLSLVPRERCGQSRRPSRTFFLCLGIDALPDPPPGSEPPSLIFILIRAIREIRGQFPFHASELMHSFAACYTGCNPNRLVV